MIATLGALLTAAGVAVGVLAAIALPRGLARAVSLGAAAVASSSAVLLAATVLASGNTWQIASASVFPLLGGLVLTVDRLGAVFLAIVGATSLASSIYAVGYLRDTALTAQRGGLAMFHLFVGGMCLVTAAGNVFTFLFSWELMALTSYLLVVSDRHQEDTASAGLWYAVMTHAGFVALTVAFLLLAAGGPLDFAALRVSASTLSPTTRLWIFALGLLAFGSKAGVVPLHVWLPRAHPAAPSHVSALMSGAMVKLGAYGCIRLLFDLLGGGPAWWGGVILVLGLVTALTGVLNSVTETHLKRLLAHSTIENMGLIFVGIGFSLLMRGFGFDNLAAIGLTVALLHAVNHACYKALMFLSAGSVLHAVHVTSLEAYGGLIRRMPQTAVFTLIGALSLAALPPFNGFPSEWLTFQVFVAGAHQTSPELAILLPLALGAIALTAGLAAVSAVRLFGITFLALPRSEAAANAVEGPATMRAAMALLAVACLVLGLTPAIVIDVLGSALPATHLPKVSLVSGWSLSLPLVGSRFAPAVVTTIVVAAALAVLGASRIGRARPRRDVPWNCGRIALSARSEYTAAAFAEPLKRVFTGFYRPTEEVTVETHPTSPYFVRTIVYRGSIRPWVELVIYEPMIGTTAWLSSRARRLQSGSIHAYLAYLIVALVGMLLLARWVS